MIVFSYYTIIIDIHQIESFLKFKFIVFLFVEIQYYFKLKEL